MRHARALARILALLDRAPRRVLRRHNRPVPLGRVQVMDRRAMLWLVRQPGTTLAERAGDRQRILAVAREQNFDTIENRVLHGYARLAAGVAREYAARHRTAAGRVQMVRGYGKTCRHLALDLRDRGVREAAADVPLNFVLQNNASYRQVWHAWRELLQRKRELDELWRWQARSWEEFCALAVIVALQSCDGARAIATSRVVFRDEQRQGRWLGHVNPLAVFHLAAQDVTVEVAFDQRIDGPLRYVGAPIWLRHGRVDDAHGWAQLSITSSNWEELRNRPIVLDWGRLEDIDAAEDEVVAKLARPLPVVPDRVRLLPHLGLWDGSMRSAGLANALRDFGAAANPNLYCLNSSLRNGFRDTGSGQRLPFHAVGSDGDLPAGLDPRLVAELDAALGIAWQQLHDAVTGRRRQARPRGR